MKIETLVQPSKTSCTCTCIAMVLGVDPQTVIDEFEDQYHTCKIEVEAYLQSKGMHARAMSANERVMFSGRLYMVAVPSLRMVGKGHMILVDLQDAESPRVLDPAKGERYVWGKPNENEVSFMESSYFPQYEILGELTIEIAEKLDLRNSLK